MKRKAVALYSGGLDSTLAIRLIQNQGIDVLAVHFYTGFCITETKRRRGEKKEDGTHYMNPALKYAAKYGFPLEIVDISDGYMDVILNPKYGYGANINPCIDCRIYMFKKAKQIMEEIGADFIISGEVLGQRPKSQKSIPMKIIERDSGLEGLILRPLSAKRLPPTIPEIKGWVDREKLEGIVGRSRKRQLELAKELGIDEFESPAGGCCYLTDENYAHKYRETMEVEGKITQEDLILFTVGRHFRLDSGTKVIVSRNEGENNFLSGFLNRYPYFEPIGKGPVAIAKPLHDNTLDEDDKQIIANIITRYSKTVDGKIDVKYNNEEILTGIPFDDETLNQWRISLWKSNQT
ncbi:hypothetical protein [Sulfurihydrogenibium azorense]|uniref:hypothetical protein n=1 Tax=Sulfurihydrogenibium azorense TaxID=309806 RepID=UPI00391BA688